MAKVIVVGLEVVDIEHENANARVRQASIGLQSGAAPIEFMPVGQSGQRVMGRRMLGNFVFQAVMRAA